MKVISQLAIFLCCLTTILNAANRNSSYPFVTGDTFRAFCEHTYDELSTSIEPEKVNSGDAIFVKTEFLPEFFESIHPKIRNQYILITHNSDLSIPGSFYQYLEDNKIIIWLGQNVDYPIHPKLHPLPIGIANRCWPHGDISIMQKARQKHISISKKYLCYLNISIGTYRKERRYVYDLFKNKKYCYQSPRKKYPKYLEDLAKSKFVLSPRGNGIDCHRTWEALLMGSYPVVLTSALDPMFEDLPVLIVEKWEDINEAMLQDHYRDFESKKPLMNTKKIFAEYWLSYINSFRLTNNHTTP